MARPRAKLIDRGHLYAGKRDPLRFKALNVADRHTIRHGLGEAWVAGYKAAQNDAREAKRGRQAIGYRE